MKCTPNQSLSLLPAMIVALFLCKIGESLVSARPVDCPTLTAGIPRFFDDIEGRCSPCSVGVCKTYLTLPEPCVCTCVRDYQNRTYREEEKRLCQDKLGELTTHPTESTHTSGVFEVVVLVWLTVLTVVWVVVVIVLSVKWPRVKASIPEDEPLLINNPDKLNNNNNKNAAGCTSPISSPITLVPKIVETYEPSSHPVTSSRPDTCTSVPKQEENPNIDSDQTPLKVMESGEGGCPVSEVGPGSPKVSLPDNDCQI